MKNVTVAVWRIGSALVSINHVYLRRARLVLGWVTVSGFAIPFAQCAGSISVCNQPSRSTQPGHPFVGRRNEYQPKGSDVLRLESMVRVRVAGEPV